MGTIINSISFCNFYNYYGSYEDNTYTFTEGINIINADNNMGKSKFYNGFLWILRDEVYDSDDKKIYPVSDSYFKMMSGKARRESDELTLGVRIIFENNNERYIITKEVRCTKESEWLYNATTEVQHTIDNEDQFIMDKTEKDDVIRKLIPYDMEKYCLLQGESMERLVDLSTLKGLENTINALADMNNLIQMCSRANELVAEAKKEYKTEEVKKKDELIVVDKRTNLFNKLISHKKSPPVAHKISLTSSFSQSSINSSALCFAEALLPFSPHLTLAVSITL